MCFSLIDNDKVISSFGELKDHFKPLIIPIISGFSLPSDDQCLCPVDIDKLSNLTGLKIIKSKDYMDWIVER